MLMYSGTVAISVSLMTFQRSRRRGWSQEELSKDSATLLPPSVMVVGRGEAEHEPEVEVTPVGLQEQQGHCGPGFTPFQA